MDTKKRRSIRLARRQTTPVQEDDKAPEESEPKDEQPKKSRQTRQTKRGRRRGRSEEREEENGAVEAEQPGSKAVEREEKVAATEQEEGKLAEAKAAEVQKIEEEHEEEEEEKVKVKKKEGREAERTERKEKTDDENAEEKDKEERKEKQEAEYNEEKEKANEKKEEKVVIDLERSEPPPRRYSSRLSLTRRMEAKRKAALGAKEQDVSVEKKTKSNLSEETVQQGSQAMKENEQPEKEIRDEHGEGGKAEEKQEESQKEKREKERKKEEEDTSSQTKGAKRARESESDEEKNERGSSTLKRRRTSDDDNGDLSETQTTTISSDGSQDRKQDSEDGDHTRAVKSPPQSRKRSKKETTSSLDGDYWRGTNAASTAAGDEKEATSSPRKLSLRSSSGSIGSPVSAVGRKKAKSTDRSSAAAEGEASMVSKQLFETSEAATIEEPKLEERADQAEETVEVEPETESVKQAQGKEIDRMDEVKETPHGQGQGFEKMEEKEASAEATMEVAEIRAAGGECIDGESMEAQQATHAEAEAEVGENGEEVEGTGEGDEEAIWQRVKRRRKDRHKEGGKSALFEPSLPISFSSVSIYSAHSPIPLPIISPLHKRLRTKDDDGDLSGTINAGRKAELGCWRRPGRTIPSPVSHKVRRRLALSGGQDPFTSDDSDRLSLWYVLATEDDPDARFHPIDNYSIYRRYEITLAQWERLGRRWNGHVDTHVEFLQNVELRERLVSLGKTGGEAALMDLAGDDQSKITMSPITKESDDEQEDDAELEDSDEDFAEMMESSGSRKKKASSTTSSSPLRPSVQAVSIVSDARPAARAPTTTSTSESAKQLVYPVPTKKPKTEANCHHCKTRKEYWLECPVEPKHRYCHRCAFKHFAIWYDDAFPSGGSAWEKGCPICQKTCPCAACRKRKGSSSTSADGSAAVAPGESVAPTTPAAEASGAGISNKLDAGSAQHVTEAQASETKGRGDEDEIDILGVSDESEEDANSPRAKHAKPIPTAQQDLKDVWEVEGLVDSRIVAGVRQYLVRWKDTWLDNQLLEVESYRSMIESTVTPTARSKAKQARKQQSLVRWKNSWEPASNLSASCIESWEAAKAKEPEQQKTTAATSARTTKKQQQGDKPKRPRGRPPKRRKQEEQAEKEAKDSASEMVVEIPIVNLEEAKEEAKEVATEPTTTETPRPTAKRKREEEEDEEEEEKEEERKADEHADPRQETGGEDEPLRTTDRQDGPSSSSAAPEEQKPTPNAETACENENAPATDQHVSSVSTEASTVSSPAAPSWLPQELASDPLTSYPDPLCVGPAFLEAPSSAAPVPSRSSRSKSAVSSTAGASDTIQLWVHFTSGQEPELITDLPTTRLAAHVKNLVRERFGLTGLIRLRLLSKDDRKGTPLDPKKTLKEQGVVDGSDVLVSQDSASAT